MTQNYEGIIKMQNARLALFIKLSSIRLIGIKGKSSNNLTTL